MQFVTSAGMNAPGARLAVQRQIQLFAVFTHPADVSGRDAHHQSIGGDIPVNHGTGADEGVFADGGATHDGAIGAEGGTFFTRVSRYSLLRSISERGL